MAEIDVNLIPDVIFPPAVIERRLAEDQMIAEKNNPPGLLKIPVLQDGCFQDVDFQNFATEPAGFDEVAHLDLSGKHEHEPPDKAEKHILQGNGRTGQGQTQDGSHMGKIFQSDENRQNRRGNEKDEADEPLDGQPSRFLQGHTAKQSPIGPVEEISRHESPDDQEILAGGQFDGGRIYGGSL